MRLRVPEVRTFQVESHETISVVPTSLASVCCSLFARRTCFSKPSPFRIANDGETVAQVALAPHPGFSVQGAGCRVQGAGCRV